MNFNKTDHKKPNVSDVLFGIRPVIEAINAGREIEKIMIQKDQHSLLINSLVVLAEQHHIPISRVPAEKLNKITRKNHQGVICFISAVIYASLDNIITECFQKGKAPLILI